MDLIPFTIHHPSTWLLIGPSFSGKTTLMSEILLRRNETFSTPIDSIVFVYREFQPAYFNLMDKIPQIQFTTSIEEAENLVKSPGIVVFDDVMSLLDNAVTNKIITSWYTQKSHHRNVSVFALFQNAYHKGAREINLNSHNLVLFRQPRDLSSVTILARQICPTQTKFLIDAFQKATEHREFAYLFVDLDPRNGKYKLFLRSSIWPTDECQVYSPK